MSQTKRQLEADEIPADQAAQAEAREEGPRWDEAGHLHDGAGGDYAVSTPGADRRPPDADAAGCAPGPYCGAPGTCLATE
jgi:hypothetical protein